MKEVIEYLKERVSSIGESVPPMDYAVVIDGVEVQKIIEFYEKTANIYEYTEQELNCKSGCMGPCGQCKDEPPNAPDITPEWDKIPEGFIFVSIDKNGEEHAYSKEPFPDDRQWRGGWHWNKTGRKFDMTNIDWEQTLSKRPAK